ncbi:mitogen-activated protein kinase MAPK [Acrasis kona]|uniref:Mitogen-activated protein kinase MAPK n=1 Tax=Acrasis kona TaxID=1008807 RepID=A0AAW2ZI75_9EUKA
MRTQLGSPNHAVAMPVQQGLYKQGDIPIQTPQHQTDYDPLYTIILEGEQWTLPRRYQIEKLKGEGSYGTVVSAINLETGKRVAIKKNRDIFPAYLNNIVPVDKNKQKKPRCIVPQHRSAIAQLRVLREVKVLRHLGSHPNITHLLDLVLPESFEKFSDVYIVTDLMETDLMGIFENRIQLSSHHIQFVMFQLLSAIQHLHNSDVLHRDIKPENILLNSNCTLRLCDFGLARACNFEVTNEGEEQTTRLSTNYVQTRQYRAPELLLNADRVGKSTDMWSVGCIMYELFNTGRVLFDGTSTQDQIGRIIRFMGTPSECEMNGSNAGIEYVKSLPYVEPNKGWLDQHLSKANVSPAALDLIKRILTWDCKKRLSASEALDHEYFATIRGSDNFSQYSVGKMDFSFESKLVVTDSDDLMTYGSLTKRECYDSILDFNGLGDDSNNDTTKTSLLQKMKNIFKKKV